MHCAMFLELSDHAKQETRRRRLVSVEKKVRVGDCTLVSAHQAPEMFVINLNDRGYSFERNCAASVGK